MLKLYFDSRFDNTYRKFTKYNQRRIRAIDRVLKLFALNPKHPSLHLEKLSGGKIWTIRLDRGNRLFFVWANREAVAIFFFVGPHDSYRTVKK